MMLLISKQYGVDVIKSELRLQSGICRAQSTGLAFALTISFSLTEPGLGPQVKCDHVHVWAESVRWGRGQGHVQGQSLQPLGVSLCFIISYIRQSKAQPSSFQLKTRICRSGVVRFKLYYFQTHSFLSPYLKPIQDVVSNTNYVQRG